MSEPRKPRELKLKVRFSGNNFDGYDVASGSITMDDPDEVYHVREVLPETPSKDAESAAKRYIEKLPNGLCATEINETYKAHLAGQSIGEARRTREICDWLDEVHGNGIIADEIRTRFLK